MCSIYYTEQTRIVITLLMKEHKISREDAMRLWLTSKTRFMIQEEYKLDHISGARCYDELLMEMNKDPYWMQGQFD